MTDFQDRLIIELPTKECSIKILDGDNHVRDCTWKPFDILDYDPYELPSEGFLGSAIDNEDKTKFHAWQGTDQEFKYFKEA